MRDILGSVRASAGTAAIRSTSPHGQNQTHHEARAFSGRVWWECGSPGGKYRSRIEVYAAMNDEHDVTRPDCVMQNEGVAEPACVRLRSLALDLRMIVRAHCPHCRGDGGVCLVAMIAKVADDGHD